MKPKSLIVLFFLSLLPATSYALSSAKASPQKAWDSVAVTKLQGKWSCLADLSTLNDNFAIRLHGQTEEIITETEWLSQGDINLDLTIKDDNSQKMSSSSGVLKIKGRENLLKITPDSIVTRNTFAQTEYFLIKSDDSLSMLLWQNFAHQIQTTLSNNASEKTIDSVYIVKLSEDEFIYQTEHPNKVTPENPAGIISCRRIL